MRVAPPTITMVAKHDQHQIEPDADILGGFCASLVLNRGNRAFGNCLGGHAEHSCESSG